MARALGLTILLASTAAFCFAGAVGTPEIDASTAPAAIGLLAGAVLVLRARKNRNKQQEER